MTTEAWKEMEKKAAEIMSSKWKREKLISDKFEKLHAQNIANPITTVQTVVSEKPPETEIDPITYNPAFYVLGYIFPQDTVRKRNKRKR